MKPVLFESHFFPCIYFFNVWIHHPVWIEKFENYQKRSFRNKCIIAGPQGIHTLTVPLKKGKHQQQTITEVKIAYDEPWQKKHLATIRAAYGKAPFFAHYYPRIEQWYADAGEFLFDLNISIMRNLAGVLHLTDLKFTESYEKNPSAIDLRGRLKLKDFGMIPLPHYSQVFEDRYGYLSNLSIMDLLFCYGPETSRYLQSFQPPGLD